MSDLSEPVNTTLDLRRLTEARVALGRVGSSLPTQEVLGFAMAHARARDAVHLPLATESLHVAFEAAGFPSAIVRTSVGSRAEYLRRPDLGRQLHPDSRSLLLDSATTTTTPRRLTVIVADGLSSLAATRHALPLLLAARARLTAWTFDTVFLATEARVALPDEVGALRHAEAAVILLGERPGLSSPDSLGVYLTYAPEPGRVDAERNCISNVRAAGLSYAEAAFKLHYLLEHARLAGRSGVAIKDNSVWEPVPTTLP